MCVLSREDSHPSNTNVLMHRLKNGNVLVCYINSLSVTKPTLLMFPVNGRVVKVSELKSEAMTKLDDHFEHIVDAHAMFNPNYYGAEQDDIDVTDGIFETEHYYGQYIELDKEFYKKIDKRYYENLETFMGLTRSLVETKTDERDKIFVVLAQAKHSIDRGIICVEYEFPASGKLIIPGTLHEDREAPHKYEKGGMNVFLTTGILETLEKDLTTQIVEYIKHEESSRLGYSLVTCDEKEKEKSGSARCWAVLKHYKDETGDVKMLLRCVCQIIRTEEKIIVEKGINLEGGTLLSLGDFKAKNNSNLILY